MAFLTFLICYVLLIHFSGHIVSPERTPGSLVKPEVSYEPIFTTNSQFYNFLGDDERSRRDAPANENSIKVKPKISKKPVFTPNRSDYNVLSNESEYDGNDPPIFDHPAGLEQQIPQESMVEDDSSNYGSIGKKEPKNKKRSWKSTVNKALTKNRKNNFQRLSKSDDGTIEYTDNGSKEWDYIYKPFNPSKTDTSDAESTTSSKSWSKVLSKLWPNRSNSPSRLSRSATSSSISSTSSSFSSNSELDRLIDSLLDKYDGKDYYGESVDTAEEPLNSGELLKKEVGQREDEELPDKPSVPVGNFILCSEIRSPDSNLHVLDIFDDGKSPTCILACLFYKIKNSQFYVRPEGRCDRLSMSGPGKGQPILTDFSCVCNDGLKWVFRYIIVQNKDTLYHVIDKEMGTKVDLGTTEEISEYVRKNFRQYLKDFLKEHRGIDWVGMYEYVRDFRWNRHHLDDRPVGKYLSDSLKEELDDIRHFWTVTLRERLLKAGIHKIN